jgi:hypothetical protein
MYSTPCKRTERLPPTSPRVPLALTLTLTLTSVTVYTNVGGSSYRLHLEWPSTILAVLAALLMIPIYVFYFYGEWFRARSKFALSIAGERKDKKVAKTTRREIEYAGSEA